MVEETVDEIVSVYKFTCLTNGKCYIGITNSAPRRQQEHLKRAFFADAQGALARAIRKHGKDAFVFQVLYEAVDQREARAIERALIAEHGTMAPNGYNMSTGGETTVGRRLAPEARRLISEAAKAQWQDPEKRARAMAAAQARILPESHKDHLRRQAALMKGVPRKRESVEKGRAKLMGHAVSDETRAKIGATSTGRKWTDEAKARRSAMLRQMWADGVFKKRVITPEHRAAMSAGRVGKARGPYKTKLRKDHNDVG